MDGALLLIVQCTCIVHAKLIPRKELNDSFSGADGYDLRLWGEGERRVIQVGHSLNLSFSKFEFKFN